MIVVDAVVSSSRSIHGHDGNGRWVGGCRHEAHLGVSQWSDCGFHHSRSHGLSAQRNPDSESSLLQDTKGQSDCVITKEKKDVESVPHPKKARILRNECQGQRGGSDPPEINVRAVHPIVEKPYLAIFSS